MRLLLFILAAMIFYDLTIHVVYLFNKEYFFIKNKLNWWPNFGEGKKFNRKFYQIFWTTYWLIGVLLVVFLILKN